MNKTFNETLDQAIASANAHEKELLSIPGVVTVGAGPKRKAGKITGQAAIIVTVRKKLTKRELESLGQKPLPTRLDGVPLDVVELGKPVEAPEIVAAFAKARKVLEANLQKWLATPNVTGVGIGYKTTNNETDFSQVAIKFSVARKLPVADLHKRGYTEIPAKVDGVPTDVEEVPVLRPSGASGSRDDRKDPIMGGLTVGVNTKPFWYGTLGSIVFDRTTGEQMVLSNQHVLDGPAGTEVVQPSPIELDDSLEISFQLDICNPLHFFRLDTPNTTVGTILAGAAAGAILAAALSDEIDPTRRGQEATVPPGGAKTLRETQNVTLDYPEMPIPGTHFKVGTNWKYTRQTDAGDFSHNVSEVKQNPHALADKLLLTDKTLYNPGDVIRLFGLILPEACAPKPSDPNPTRPVTAAEIRALTRANFITPTTLRKATEGGLRSASSESPPRRTTAAVLAASSRRCRCDIYHVTAVLTPTKQDRAFPIVLREPVSKLKSQLLNDLLEIVIRRDDKDLLAKVFRLVRYGCLYTGQLNVEDIPLGPWRHYLFVQTVNFARDGMKPTEAAQIIGGLPVSNNTKPTLDVACGPLVIEDGQFDVELI